MVLFLSDSFLKRLQFIWKPDLKAFLIGQRNLNFFTPDSVFEVSEITAATIDDFLKKQELADRWELLGFLTKDSQSFFPGYVEILTTGSKNPEQWSARIQVPDEKGMTEKSVAIKFSQR
jgi:hypothetical protein